MRVWKQAVVSLAVLGVAVAVWARHFPAVALFLERAGLAVASVEPGGGAPERPRPDGPPTVLGAPVTQATINDALSAIGTGLAARSVTVTPYASGRIVQIDVASGDFAPAGAPLARLDSEAEAIALDRARLTLADARATLARDQMLVESDAVTEVQLRTDQLAVDQGELEVRDAELALERRVIRAPFDGWVGILGIDIGDQVSTETPVATMDDRSHIMVDFRVPERFIGQLRVGAPVSARALARPSLELAGVVATIDSRVSADTRTLRVRASLDNSADLLRAGMAFRISMRFPGDTFPAVDPLAIQWSAGGAYVWTGPEGLATQVPVRIVQRNDDRVLVDADLAPGTLVVTEGVQVLRAGAPFRFENAPPAAAAGAPRPRKS
jgi:RND family efflux transporter MFP subunit